MSFTARLWRGLPLMICLAGAILALYPKNLMPETVLVNLPYILGLVLLCMTFIFNRLRFFIAVVAALFSFWFIRQRLQFSLSEPHIWLAYAQLNVWFCFTLIVGSVWPEKGLKHAWGFGFVVLSAVSAGLLWHESLNAVSESLVSQAAFISQTLFEKQYWFSSGLALLHGATVVWLLLLYSWRKSVADQALLITALMGCLVFFEFATDNISAYGFGSLLLALFIVFQQSNFQVTYMDALTGIPGRRSLEEFLASLGRRYCIAMLDVDHFKKFNDTHGHDVGDQVLKMVASQIARVKGGGRAFRYGGEEFTIVFKNQEAAEIKVYLEAVREAVANYKMVLRADDRSDDVESGKRQRGQVKPKQDRKLSVTISIGASDSQRGLKPEDVIKAADQSLYKAKQQGRNCTVIGGTSGKAD